MKKMKQLLSVLLVVVMLTGALSARAAEEVASGTCGENLTWVLTDDGTLTISGTGAMDDYARYGAPWDAHKNKIVSVVVENGVTSIGDNAFAYYNFLASVTLSATVETIGEEALTGCRKLETITVEDGSEHFSSIDGVLFDSEATKLIIYPN
ncbi:MAG: leucine-rich repeat protein [Oscillospiraceae bacterium]|nr:leucine-rich repeat protein [Oscillospiraceae bacterium]